jgi:hypothetical protein
VQQVIRLESILDRSFSHHHKIYHLNKHKNNNHMKKAFRYFASNLIVLTVTTLVFIGWTSGPTRKQFVIEPIQPRMIVLDSGKVRFQLPEHFSETSELIDYFKKLDPTILCWFEYENNLKEKYTITVTKLDCLEEMPMEIAFNENIIKYNLINEGATIARLMDFGIFDSKGKRYRYKKTRLNEINKIIYYFMENDNARYVYQLALIQFTEPNLFSDSLIAVVAHSFDFIQNPGAKIK